MVTLQGLNLESQYTTVKIPLEGSHIEEITKLLDKINSFHPIFFFEYIVSPTELIIRSKLPTIWRISSAKINSLSKAEITYEEAESFVIDTVISRKVKSMSTIPILQAAHNKNRETTLAVMNKELTKSYELGYGSVHDRYYVLGCGKGSQISGSIGSSKDSYFGFNIQKDKWSTNTMIQRLNLPIPKWEVIDDFEDLEKIWKHFDKPVVIKPTGLVGGHGVVVGVKTLEEARKAYKFAKDASVGKKEYQRKIMIQQQIQGEDYRLLVVDGKLEVVTKRIPAFVIGNGKNTIQELIEETNKDPRRDISNPAHILKQIKIDEPLKEYIKEQGYTLESIPEKDIKVPVRKVASMSQGGVTEDFTDQVGKEIRLMAESIASSIHSFVLGVDILCRDISKPLTLENGGILEINTMPESYLNFFPTIGTQRGYVANTFVEKLLKNNLTKKIVVVGQTTQHIPTLLRKKLFGEKELTIGELIGERYLINGLEINGGTPRWEQVEAIKCNASLDTIILHHRDWKSVKEDGLGFDHIHTLYITKLMAKEKEYINLMKKYKGMKLIDNIKII